MNEIKKQFNEVILKKINKIPK